MSEMEWLLDYASSPYHQGECDSCSHRSSLSSSSCADCVTLQIEVANARIVQAWHLSCGCLVCQSAASYLCQWCEGMLLEELKRTTEADYLQELGQLTPMRQQCALLSFRCLKSILADLPPTSG